MSEIKCKWCGKEILSDDPYIKLGYHGECLDEHEKHRARTKRYGKDKYFMDVGNSDYRDWVASRLKESLIEGLKPDDDWWKYLFPDGSELDDLP